MARKIEVQIVGDDSSLQRSFRNSSQASGRFGRSLANVGKAAALAAGGGIIALGYGLKKSVEAALDAEKAETRLASAFKTVNVTAQQRVAAQEAVSKVSRSAALDDEALMDTLGRLTRVTGSVTEAQRGMAISADVARGRGLELEAATKIVEKAYLGNVGALKRIGIEIPKVTAAQDKLKASGQKATEEQKKQAKALDDTATRQKAIAALQEQYAGASERFGQTASGAVQRFQVAWENLQESLGARVLPFLTSALGSISGLLEAEGFRAKLTIVWEGLKEAAANLATALTAAVREIDWGPIGTAIGEGVSQALEAAKDTGTKLGKSLDEQINTVDWRGLGRRVGEEITGGVGEGMQKGKGGENFFAVLGRLTVTWYAAMFQFGAGLAERLAAPIAAGIAALPRLIGQGLARAFQAGAQAIQAAASNWQTWARQAGMAVVNGVGAGLRALGAKIGASLANARSLISGAAGGFYRSALQIGAGIASGIIAGIGDLASRVAGAVGDKVRAGIDAVKGRFGIDSPSRVTAKELGEPLGAGVIQGWIYSTRDLPAKMAASVKAAIEKGRQAVAAARDRFRSAFSDLASDALSAFDAVTSKMKTPSEKALEEFDRRKQLEGMQRELSEARAALTAAEAEGDPDRIVDAQRRVQEAEEALWRDAVEQQAKIEREALDDRNALRRRHFEERLAALEAEWAAEGVSASKAHKQLMALFASFGVDWRKSGKAMGLALAEGIRESEKAVVSAVSSVANAGRRAVSGGEAPRSFQASVAGAGVAPNVNVYVAGSVQAEQDLATTIRDTLARNGVRNDGTGL